MKLSPIKVILLLALLLFAVAAFNNLEQVERTIDEGPSTAVRQNSFYAAGKFLTGKGYRVVHRSSSVPVEDLAVNDTLFLTDTSTLTSEKYAESLLQWVYQGGNLIWEYSESDTEIALATLTGITATGTDDEVLDETEHLLETIIKDEQAPAEIKKLTPREKVRARINNREQGIAQDRLTQLYLPDASAPLNLLFNTEYSLSHTSIAGYSEHSNAYAADLLLQAGDASSRHLIQLAIGSGTVTVVTDASVWSNQQIGLFDHAHSLWQLTPDQSTVYIQRYADWPSLLTLIQTYAPETAVTLCLLLIGWLIYNGLRFGPVRPLASQQRRSLKEHIVAIGQFHYRHKHHNHLLSALRSQIRKKANIADTGQTEEIARLCALPVTEVEQALSEKTDYSDAELVSIIQLLIKIRDTL